MNHKKEMHMFFVSRRLIFISVIIFQITASLYICYAGKRGYKDISLLKREIKMLETAIECQKNKTYQIYNEVSQWKNSLFVLQKYAREKLHMGKKDETIFFYE